MRLQSFAVIMQLKRIISLFSAKLIWMRLTSLLCGLAGLGGCPQALHRSGQCCRCAGTLGWLCRASWEQQARRLEVPCGPQSVGGWAEPYSVMAVPLQGLVAGVSRQSCSGAESRDIGAVCARRWLGPAWFVRWSFAPRECGRGGNFFTWARMQTTSAVLLCCSWAK